MKNTLASSHANALGSAFNHGSNLLDVGEGTSLGFVVGMADVVANERALATEVTLPSHDY